MADSAAAMTVDFLRARLLSERSVSRASKERADQLAARVAELEEQVRAVTAQRRQAEREAAEVLAVLESQGFCGSLSDAPDDSGSDNDGDEEKDGAARVTHGDAEQREQEPAAAAAKGEPGNDRLSESIALQPAGGLSWKGRSVSPRKARQLRQRHRRSYTCLLASSEDPSSKYRMGQSCRKNKRKELIISSGRSTAPENGGDGGGGRAEFDGEVGGDERSWDGAGQYVIRCQKDGEMERVLEKQAELIGQYEAEEKAQWDWEKKFNDNRSSPKGDVVQPKSSGKTHCIAETPENASEEYAARRREAVAGEHRTASISAQGSSNNSTNQDQQGDANSDRCSSDNANSASSRQLAIRSPSESSPSSDTLVSKVSGWSSSRFHDHADDGELDSRSCPQTSDIDVESVLQALQRARISLQQELGRPLPPSQVTLALPAPGDEYRTEEDPYEDDGGDSYRGEPGSSSPSRVEMLALPAPEDYHSCRESASLSVDGADTSSLTEKPSSSWSSPRQEVLALMATGDDRLAGERDGDMKIPVSSPGLFRLPTDSFPEDEVLSRSHGSDLVELRLKETARHDACRDDDDEDDGVSAMQFYDPHGTAPASGRCNVPPSSGFTVRGASFLSGTPGLTEKLRRGRSLGDADMFMQRACDYTVTNEWML